MEKIFKKSFIFVPPKESSVSRLNIGIHFQFSHRKILLASRKISPISLLSVIRRANKAKNLVEIHRYKAIYKNPPKIFKVIFNQSSMLVFKTIQKDLSMHKSKNI
jgi:hypothetical protein